MQKGEAGWQGSRVERQGRRVQRQRIGEKLAAMEEG
jgi:hypothetical protein